MKYIYALFILLLAIFLAAFIQQNGTQLQLKYFSWSTPFLPLSLYVILSFAAGYILAVVVGFSTGLRFRFRASGAERELRQLRDELDKLRKKEPDALDPGSSEDQVEASSQGDLKEGAGGDPADIGPGHNHDSKTKTVVIGSGGEEEKQ